MRKFLLTFSVLLAATPANAASFEELMSKGDAAMAAKQYSEAENFYSDAQHESLTRGAASENQALLKLKQLYSVSGLQPLDSEIKAKLAKLSAPAAVPQPVLSRTSTASVSKNAVGSYPPATGQVVDDLKKALNDNIVDLCKKRLPGFQGVADITHSAFQLPNSTYQVLTGATAAVMSNGKTGEVKLTIVTTFKRSPDRKLTLLNCNFDVADADNGQGSSSTSAFNQWSKEQQAKIADDKKRQEQEASAMSQAAAAREQESMKSWEEASKAGEAHSPWSKTYQQSQQGGAPAAATPQQAQMYAQQQAAAQQAAQQQQQGAGDGSAGAAGGASQSTGDGSSSATPPTQQP